MNPFSDLLNAVADMGQDVSHESKGRCFGIILCMLGFVIFCCGWAVSGLVIGSFGAAVAASSRPADLIIPIVVVIAIVAQIATTFMHGFIFVLRLSLAMVQSGTRVIRSAASGLNNLILTPSIRLVKGLPGKMPARILNLLDLFACFCSDRTRTDIECIRTDLTQDIQDRRLAGRGELLNSCLTLWDVVVGAIFPIIWGKCRRLLGSRRRA